VTPEEGSVVLSKKKADFMRVWERIREAHEKDEGVKGTLVKKIKGGVVVDLMGVDAFLPGSQIALRRCPNIDELLGQSFEFKIIKLNSAAATSSSRAVCCSKAERKRTRRVDEGAFGQSGAEGRREKHHRLRRLHRPGRRGRPAATSPT